MNITLDTLKIENFKAIKSLTLSPCGGNLAITGKNKLGKTTVYDAFLWLLFGKNSAGETKFNIKPTFLPIETENSAEATFTAEGTTLTLKKVYASKYVKNTGEYKSSELECYINGVPKKIREFEADIADLIDEETFRLLTNPKHFTEDLDWKKHREILFSFIGLKPDSEIADENPDFDMQMDNYLFPAPFRNQKTGVVTLTLITGYEGEKHLAFKFARKPPKDIRAELVYSTDTFIPFKKSGSNRCESYEFKINNPFDRGAVIGGFGYIEYDDPADNVLVLMSEAEILKRKPPYANDNFWGKWKEKMYLKTIIKETCRKTTLDVGKVRDYRNTLDYEKQREVEYAKVQMDEEKTFNANTGEIIDADFGDDVPAEEPPAEEPPAEAESEDGKDLESTEEGPLTL